ncbi:MAG: hypothetical protein ACW981_02815 [Candidatus Hodarchaeales archaeon]|jgi:surfactin synthase thioesterase subunit
MIFTIAGNGKDMYAIVGPGSTQLAYNETHPIIEMLSIHCEEIYSFDLPGHGIGQLKENQRIGINKAIEQLYLDIEPKIRNKSVILVGFSLGGLMLLKLWKSLVIISKEIHAYFIGCGFKIDPSNRQKVQKFFTPEFYTKHGWEDLMLKNHGKTWKTLLANINIWLQPKSDLFLSIEEINNIMSHKEKILFILTRRDQSFTVNAINFENMFDFRIKMIKGDHFSYFSPRVGLNEVKENLEEFLNKVM